MRLTIAFVLILASGSSGCGSGYPDETFVDFTTLRGTWIADGGNIEFKIGGDQFQDILLLYIDPKTDKILGSEQLTLDTTKRPKRFEMRPQWRINASNGKTEFPEAGREPQRGIYAIQDGMLLVALYDSVERKYPNKFTPANTWFFKRKP